MVSPAFMLRSALIALVSVLATLATSAHVHLAKQGSAANAEIVVPPQALTLNFSEGAEPGFSGTTLTGPNKEQIKTGKASRSEQGKTQLIVPLD